MGGAEAHCPGTPDGWWVLVSVIHVAPKILSQTKFHHLKMLFLGVRELSRQTPRSPSSQVTRTLQRFSFSSNLYALYLHFVCIFLEFAAKN